MVTQKPCEGYGVELQQRRKGMGMSVEELAWVLGTDAASVERLEKEVLYPSSSFIRRIADGLNMDVAEVEERMWCDHPGQCGMERS